MKTMQTRKWNILNILRAVALRLAGHVDVKDAVLIYSTEEPFLGDSVSLADSLSEAIKVDKNYKIDEDHKYNGQDLLNMVTAFESSRKDATLISGLHRTTSDTLYRAITGEVTERPERIIDVDTLQVAAAANGQHDLTSGLSKQDRAETAIMLYRAGLIASGADLERVTGYKAGSRNYAWARARVVVDQGFKLQESLTMPDKEIGKVLLANKGKGKKIMNKALAALAGKTAEKSSITTKQYGEAADTVIHDLTIAAYQAIEDKDIAAYKAIMITIDCRLVAMEPEATLSTAEVA